MTTWYTVLGVFALIWVVSIVRFFVGKPDADMDAFFRRVTRLILAGIALAAAAAAPWMGGRHSP